MTVLEAQEDLIKWFVTNDIFNLEKDLLNVSVSLDQTSEINKLILLKALENLTSLEIVSKLDDTNFVLNKKLCKFIQTIELNGELCLLLSNVINKYCTILNEPNETSNPLNITGIDIQNLINIIFLLEKK